MRRGDKNVPSTSPSKIGHRRFFSGVGALVVGIVAIGTVSFAAPAGAAAYEDSVGLGTAGAYSVLAGSTVTNTGSSVLGGSVGVSPGSAITGFPPGIVGGASNAGNAAAAGAQSDATAAYLVAAGRTPTGSSLGSALVGGTLQPGVYNAASALGVSGAVTLDGQGDPNSVFIFQVGAALTTATSTSIVLIGAAQVCNVFWQVGTSATLGVTNTFVGTIMAAASVTVNSGTTVAGRALAQIGAVTLDSDTFTSAACVSTPTTTALTTTSAATGGTATLTATVAATGANAPTGTVTFTSNGVTLGTSAIGLNGVATLTVPAGTVAGNRPITAHFTGLGNYAPSTSAVTTLVITAAPVPTTVATPTTTVLASTGAGQLTGLTATAAALLAFGIGLVWVSARRARRRWSEPSHTRRTA
jgi:hypothetical protein